MVISSFLICFVSHSQSFDGMQVFSPPGLGVVLALSEDLPNPEVHPDVLVGILLGDPDAVVVDWVDAGASGVSPANARATAGDPFAQFQAVTGADVGVGGEPGTVADLRVDRRAG